VARLLWVADYGLGSYFPIVPIVSELRTRGHEIVMLAGPEGEVGEETFRALGFEFRPNGTVPASFRLEPESYLDLTLRRAADVLDLLRAESFDAVVVDCLQHGAGLAAEAAGVPWISYIHYAIDESAAMVDHRLRRLKGRAEFRDVEHRRWWETARRAVGLEPDPRPLEQSRWCTFSSSLTLVLGLPELALRPDAELPRYVHRVGPVLWEPPWDGQLPAWLDRLGRDRPAVLAANSTTGDKDEQTILDLGEGLAEDDLDLVATVTTTRTLPPLPVNTIVTSFLPHSLLISKASAIVCSAGYGLTTKAACAGVPLVVVPRSKDQFVVAAAAGQAGLAEVLMPAELSPARLADAVRRVLSEPSFAASAARLRRAAARYEAPTAAGDLIEQLVEHAGRRGDAADQDRVGARG
jgi:UDP:flavonoid glycosyltransferase YjiC (YdhE family)